MGHALVVNGIAGRMGRLVAEEIERAGLGPVAGCDPTLPAGSLALGARTVPIVADLASGLVGGGVIVDFSHPGATSALVELVAARQARLVVGTTGQSEAQLDALRQAATRVPVVLARNFALGLNRLLELIPRLRVLLGDGFQVECMEAHHSAKRDAPSGTALAWLDALFGDGPRAPRVHGRHGAEVVRGEGEVGVHSLRLGGIVGEHALLFANDHEIIELRHRALDRSAFVSGVPPAVRFVRDAAPGLYSMQDVMRHAGTAAT